MADANLTAAQLREILDYDPETGLFTWAISRRGCRRGDQTGAPHRNGYVMIGINRRARLAHRLAWLHTYGEWPKGQIDHINGVRADNRLANLRDVPGRINRQNQRAARSDNRETGLLGVYKNHGQWGARIQLNGRQHYLGNFQTPEEAHAAYIKAKRLMHPGCTL
jgi:hypothetical protein